MSKTARDCAAHNYVRDNTASGDPAMALRSSIRFTRTDLSVRAVGGFHKSRHATAGVCLSMIFSENRNPLFGIMLTPAHRRARMTTARETPLLSHDLSRKPVPTFRDHALAANTELLDDRLVAPLVGALEV